ncbi:MAG: 16S rRNA (cytosine(1402)-N(4))-methyltransferase RsmH [bacterium]
MYHEPVLAKEVIEGLNPQPNENFIDCTLGDGGHTIEILRRTAPNGKVLVFELDKKAIAVAEERLKKEGLLKRVEIINDNFRNLKKYQDKLSRVDGILADLGLRSGQLEEGGGGFSFQKDEPLDMRFGKQGKSAAEIVNNYSKSELEFIFRKYGEERNAGGIAEKIVEARKIKLIKTTGELSEIILQFYRDKFKTKKEIPWVGGIHPATRVFQALRIEANDELGALQQLLNDGVEVLSSGGRFTIISYHSLEDRIVKRFYRTSPHLVIITKKPIKPSEEEAQKNKRARSAKLRIAIKK